MCTASIIGSDHKVGARRGHLPPSTAFRNHAAKPRQQSGAKMSDKWWRERWRRQEAACDRFDKIGPDTSDAEIIDATADYLIEHYSSPRRPYRLHLGILNMSAARPVS